MFHSLGPWTLLSSWILAIGVHGDEIQDPKEDLKDFLVECRTPCDDADFPHFNNFVFLFNDRGKILREENGTILRANKQVLTTDKLVFFGIMRHPDRGYLIKGSSGYLVANEYDMSISFSQEYPCTKEDVEELKKRKYEEVLCEVDNCEEKNNSKYPGTKCQKASWSLLINKVQERNFLQIRSWNGLYMATDKDDEISLRKLDKDNVAEYFIGYNTNFLNGYSLKKEEDVHCPDVSPPLEENQCGDIAVEYITPRGEKKEGMVCDSNFFDSEAKKICSGLGFSGSLPTFSAHFTSRETDELPMALRDLDCGPANIALNCTFKTSKNEEYYRHLHIPGRLSEKQCLDDRRAGVICGSKDQIEKLKNRGAECNETRNEVAAIYSARKQMQKISYSLNENNRHWGELLLPIPMAISMVSSVLLTTGSFDKVIELNPPNGGYKFLRFQFLSSNLGQFANSMADSFLMSKRNMGLVKINSKNIHVELSNVTQYFGITDKDARDYVLNETVKTILEKSADSVQKIDDIIEAFDLTQSIATELSETMVNSYEFSKKEKELWSEISEREKAKQERLRNRREELEKELKTYDKEIEKAKREFFDRVEELKKQRCTNNGLDVCNECKQQDRAISVDEHGNVACTKYEKVCSKFESSDGYCEKEVQYCANWFIFGCINYKSRCGHFIGPKRECIKWDKICLEPIYIPPGYYCMDLIQQNGRKSSELSCGVCKSYQNVLKDVETLDKNIAMMRMQMGTGNTNYGAISAILETNMDDLKKLIKLFEKVIESREAILKKDSENPEKKGNKVVKRETLTEETEEMKNGPSVETENVASNIESKKSPADVIVKRVKKLESQVMLMNQTLGIKLSSLKQGQNKYASYGKDIIEETANIVPEALKCTKTAADLAYIKDIMKHIKLIGKKSEEAISNLKRLDNEKVGTLELGGMMELSQEANALYDNRLKEAKRSKELESVAERMMKGMERMQQSTAKINDLDEVIKYLNKIIKELNNVKAMWVQIKTFFIKFEGLLKETGYEGLCKKIERIRIYPNEKMFLNQAKQESVKTLGMNFYVYRIASFYDKLIDSKLITKMFTMCNYLISYDPSKSSQENIKEIERMRNDVIQDAKENNEKIWGMIMQEEKKTTERLTTDIRLLKKGMLCAKESPNVSKEELKDAQKFEEIEETREKEWKNKDLNVEPDKTTSSKDIIPIPRGTDIDVPDIEDVM